MKRKNVIFIFVLSVIVAHVHATDVECFIANLNSNWIDKNYSGIRETITNRLANVPNDLPALIAKADYYSVMELDMSEASNAVSAIKVLTNSLNWESNRWDAILLNAMNGSIENPEQSIQDGYIFGFSTNQLEQLHQESPTNYPVTLILPSYSIIQYGTDD